jgi:hypothetical protein
MKNFDLNAFGLQELTHREMIKTNGGDPLAQLVYELAKLIIYYLFIVGPTVVEENCNRAARDDYQPWADLGHR